MDKMNYAQVEGQFLGTDIDMEDKHIDVYVHNGTIILNYGTDTKSMVAQEIRKNLDTVFETPFVRSLLIAEDKNLI